MNIPVMVGGCVYHTGMCVMDIKIVMMDLMKQTVVRDLELKFAYNRIIMLLDFENIPSTH